MTPEELTSSPMDTLVFIAIVFGVIGAVYIVLLAIMKIGKNEWLKCRWRKVNQIWFLLLAFCFLLMATYSEGDDISIIEMLTSTITSAQLIAFIPLVYFVWKVPTKDDLNRIESKLDRHIENTSLHN